MNRNNPFETGEQKLIPAVLIYAHRPLGEVLMIRRAANKLDCHSGKCNGLGGKLEAMESPHTAAQREFLEEAGVSIPKERFRMRGVLQFPHFKPHKREDWLVFLFTVELLPAEKPAEKCAEGTLFFAKESELLDLPLWEGDKYFLSQLFPYKEKINHSLFGSLWYEDGKVKSWEIHPL